MEREKFEESLKNAFSKAEISPSDSVWTNIELDLEKEKGGDLKKRLFFYQMVAAASVLFALAIGGVGFYNSSFRDQTSTGNLAMEQPRSTESLSADPNRSSADNSVSNDSNQTTPLRAEAPSSEPDISEGNRSKNRVSESTHSSPAEAKDDQFRRSKSNGSTRITTEDHGNLQAAADRRDSVTELPTSVADRALEPFYTPAEKELKFASEQQQVDPVVAMLARLEQRAMEVRDDHKSKKRSANRDENLWTSIGFAAGSFNSMQPSASTPSTGFNASSSLAAPIVDQETNASGYSYSMGMNVGMKLSERWVLQGGVNYLTQASDYTSNNVVMESGNQFQQRFRPATTNELINTSADALSNKLVYSAPYNINNSMRYLSVPMQAGYLLVNRTFGLQLNAGVATDLFLQNTIRADSDQLAKTSQSAGTDSPYRAFNLSGLLGTEVSYRFGEHYRVSLNPGFRYPLNTIYKSELGVQSTPLTFDVGLRFRYIFN